jgi:hypothetical protein
MNIFCKQTLKQHLLCLGIILCLPSMGAAQVNSGSNGSDGEFNPMTNTVINMADHPTGIYQYTSVNIPSGIIVSFIPNANNTPVVWLVQSNCVINGNSIVRLSGDYGAVAGGLGGPGGFRGGDRGSENNPPTSGQGPGGGQASLTNCYGGSASYGTIGGKAENCSPGGQQLPGQIYGNSFLIPLLGGSGGGGSGHPSTGPSQGGGGGGGGAILIAASGFIELNGAVESQGGSTYCASFIGGSGSGGAVRLVASVLKGNGRINTLGGPTTGCGGGYGNAGNGRVRLDGFDIQFSGNIDGVSSRGYQPIIIPVPAQGAQLNVMSVGGAPVSASPTGQIATPDAILSAQQNNPIPIVVSCANIPLNTQIIVRVTPANGAVVSGTGFNSTGTLSSSTATISLTMPRGGGIIYATAAISN